MPRDRQSRVIRTLLLAGVVGAALGVFEASYWLAREMTPSTARRIGSATAYAGALSGILALLGGSAIELLAAIGRRRRWRIADDSTVRWIGWTFCTTFVVLLRFAERRYIATTTVERRGLLVLAVVLAIGAALVIGWLRRRGGRFGFDALTRAAARPGLWLAISLAAVGVGAVRLLLTMPEETGEPVRRATADPGAPNIVLVVADTLRADALGCYGASRARTPTLDAVAERGVLFEKAIAPSSWTLPSVVSLLTSTHPREHGFVDFVDTVPIDLEDLPGALSRAGYGTYASVGNVLMNELRGFAAGYDFYDVYGFHAEGRLAASRLLSGLLLMSGALRTDDPGKRPLVWPSPRPPFVTIRWSHYTYDHETNRPILELLEGGLEEPFFLYVHYLAPHEPYLLHPFRAFDSPPETRPENLEALWRRYLSEVQYLDAAFGELMTALDRAGHADDTIVAFTSDHGEEFLEHEHWGHGYHLHQEVIDVPLILAGPGLPRGTRESSRVSLLDLAPTLLELAGVGPPAGFRGRSLVSLQSDPPAEADLEPGLRPVFSETASRMLTPHESHHAVLRGRWKLIRRAARDGSVVRYELYDLERDPLETRPLAVGPEHAELVALLDGRAQGTAEADQEALSESEMEALRALGYVN